MFTHDGARQRVHKMLKKMLRKAYYQKKLLFYYARGSRRDTTGDPNFVVKCLLFLLLFREGYFVEAIVFILHHFFGKGTVIL